MEKKESTALATIGRYSLSLSEVNEISQIFIESGLFKDTKEISQAKVKVMAGQEIGLMPFESMSGLDIISGKIAISGKVMSAKVASSGKYHYRVIEINNTKCSIDFYEGKELIGNSTFTIEDAEKITYYDYKANRTKKLTEKENWVNYPRNMLFNRAMSNGQRWYCPDVFGGVQVYTHEEMGVDVDGEGDPINITPEESKPTKQPKVVKQKPQIVVETQEPSPYTITTTVASYSESSPAIDEEPQEQPEPEATPPDPIPDTDKKQTPQNATETPSCDLQIPKSLIEKVKGMKPREAYDEIANYAIQGQGHHLQALVKKYCPERLENGLADWQIPESAVIVMLKEVTGLKFKKGEKAVKCKEKGCDTKITEPEAERHGGLCMEHFDGNTEDD